MSAMPMQRRMVLLTYDYELFFSRCGSVERCLLEPTERILGLARRCGGMPSTFFVDALHLLRSRDADAAAREEFERISEQLRSMVAQGHRVELHLHPHWLDAVRESGAWHFPSYERYRLHALPLDRMNSLFMDGARLLEEIVSPAAPGYRVRSFRAGGWCIQPSEPVTAAMRAAGIDLDSSVGPGCAAAGAAHAFDFRGVWDTRPYGFDDDVTQRDADGRNLELPISTLRVGFVDRLARRLEMLVAPRDNIPFGDGIGMQVNALPTVGARWLRRFRSGTTFLSLDDLAALTIRRALRDHRDYLCFVSHPKLMSIHSLNMLQRIAQDPSNHFVTVADAANRDWSAS